MDKLTAGAAESSWQGFCGAFGGVRPRAASPSISITKTPQVRHETGSCGIFRYFIRFSTTSTTWSGGEAELSNSFAAGADAPKDFMLITAVQASVALPAKAGEALHSHAPAHVSGKYGIFVLLGLLLEQIHAGHADHADVNALSGQDFLGFHGQGYLGAAGDQDGIRGLPCCCPEARSRPLRRRGCCRRAGAGSGGSAPERWAHLHSHGVSTRPRQSRVASGTEHVESRHGAEHGQLLDGLMGGGRPRPHRCCRG